MSKLKLSKTKIAEARELATSISEQTQEFIDIHTTVTVERTVCRLLGIDGVDEFDVPLPNVIVNQLQRSGKLEHGVANFLASALKEEKCSIQELAVKISLNEIDLNSYSLLSSEETVLILQPFITDSLYKIKENTYPPTPHPRPGKFIFQHFSVNVDQVRS